MNEIEKAAEVLRGGGVVVYPTDTLYALGVCIYNEDAVRRAYEIKRRPLSMHMPVAVGSIDRIESVAVMNDNARKIAREFLPGAVTLVLEKKENVPKTVAGEKIAVRVPDSDAALALASLAGPITATSANIHGMREPSDVEISREQLGEEVDMYIDGGKLKGIPSTIVDATGEKIKILREGAVSRERFHE